MLSFIDELICENETVKIGAKELTFWQRLLKLFEEIGL